MESDAVWQHKAFCICCKVGQPLRCVFCSFVCFFVVLFTVLYPMDKSEANGTNPSGEGSKKRAAVSTEGECTSKAARRGAPSDTCRLKDILVPRQQDTEDKEVEVEQLVKARDVMDGAAFPLVWKNLDVMTYVRQGLEVCACEEVRDAAQSWMGVQGYVCGQARTTVFEA